MADDLATLDGTTVPVTNLLAPWTKRKDQARKDRKRYELQWMINQHFAAGKQWLKYSPRDHRIIEVRQDPRNRSLQVADVLDQYVKTAVAKVAAGDFRPELLLLHDDREAELYADQVNDAFGWGWENEWDGDRKLLTLLRVLAVMGTGAIRCRAERSGTVVAEQVPHVNGQPILDKDQQAAYMAQAHQNSQPVDLKPLREARVCWDTLSCWNLLVPPGVEDPSRFPWELVVSAVPIDQLKLEYGSKAAGVTPAAVEAIGILGIGREQMGVDRTEQAPSTTGRLEDHALVYTGYLKPNREFPNGQTVIFTDDNVLLDAQNVLPYTDEPYGPRSGITYFRWTTLPNRFWAKAFIEPGIGPQKQRNKRLSQIDETIDRGQAKVFVEQGTIVRAPAGNPMEIIELKPGAPKPVETSGVAPGPWMTADIELHDANIEKALGLRSVSLGGAPAGVSAYSAMALLGENDSAKLDTVGQEFKLGITETSRDTLEAMRKYWPPNKQILIAGPENRLKAAVFNARQAIPPNYIVRAPKGAALPRTQAAEIQKVADLWNAAVTSGAVATNPGGWIQWYKESLDAGKAQDLPSDLADAAQDKAELENSLIAQGHQQQVADYDDAGVHIPVHRQLESMLIGAAAEGDQLAGMVLPLVEQHIQMHLAQQQQQQMQQMLGQAGGQPAGAPDAGGPPQMQAYDNARAVQFENRVLAPRPPGVTL